MELELELDSSRKMHVIMRRMRNEEEQLRNHLLSIQRDSTWVTQTQDLFNGLPLVANLRNGEWYGRQWEALSYFKSGDGHHKEWKFSFTRLNLHVALLSAENSGCIIVDSTRRGKQYPDSFSATVPIWCGVLNSLIFGTASGIVEESGSGNTSCACGDFFGPPWMPKSQHTAIQAVIFDEVSQMPLYLKEYIRKQLYGKLLKPLRPLWVSPVEGMLDVQGDEATCESIFSSSNASSCPFVPIILLSVSEERTEKEHRAEGFSWFYVKGAGDDQENWCRGLSPSVFWRHEEAILSSDDPDCVDNIVDAIVTEEKRKKRVTPMTSTSSATSVVVADNNFDRYSFFCFGKSGIYINQHYSECCTATAGDGRAHFLPSAMDAIIYVDKMLDAALDEDEGNCNRGWADALVGVDNVLHVHLPNPKKKNSNRKASTTSSWQEFFSTCLLFYVEIINRRRDALLLDETASASASAIQPHPNILIFSSYAACDDAQTAICTALLLSCFDAYFNSLLEPSDMRTRCDNLAKIDVQIWSGLVQSNHPGGEFLSRSLLKELNSFFINGGNSDTNSTTCCGSPISTICDSLKIM